MHACVCACIGAATCQPLYFSISPLARRVPSAGAAFLKPKKVEGFSSHLPLLSVEQCPTTGTCHCPNNYLRVCEDCAIVGVCAAGSKIGLPCDLSSAFAPEQGGCMSAENSTVSECMCGYGRECAAAHPCVRLSNDQPGD